MPIYAPFVATMTAVCMAAVIMSFASHTPAMRRTAFALAGNWCASQAVVSLTGVYDPWLWWTLIDFVTASVILARPAGRFQAFIGSTILVQVITHFVYFCANNPMEMRTYWLWLTRLAYIELALLFCWGVYDGGRAIRRARIRRHMQHDMGFDRDSVGR